MHPPRVGVRGVCEREGEREREIPGSNQSDSRRKKGTIVRKRKSDTRWPEREATFSQTGVEEERRQFSRDRG